MPASIREYHDASFEDSTAAWRSLYTRITLLPAHPEGVRNASFGHLMGYAASYYGYLWSEVYAADMFSVFKEKGILDPGLGQRYRSLILEPGGSGDEALYVREFLGRDPDEAAFLKSIGLSE